MSDRGRDDDQIRMALFKARQDAVRRLSAWNGSLRSLADSGALGNECLPLPVFPRKSAPAAGIKRHLGVEQINSAVIVKEDVLGAVAVGERSPNP